MTYPLVSELADAGIPVTVSCRVLKLARQPYYRWRGDPIRDADVLRAHRINALHDAHHEDPTFGYRYPWSGTLPSTRKTSTIAVATNQATGHHGPSGGRGRWPVADSPLRTACPFTSQEPEGYRLDIGSSTPAEQFGQVGVSYEPVEAGSFPAIP